MLKRSALIYIYLSMVCVFGCKSAEMHLVMQSDSSIKKFAKEKNGENVTAYMDIQFIAYKNFHRSRFLYFATLYLLEASDEKVRTFYMMRYPGYASSFYGHSVQRFNESEHTLTVSYGAVLDMMVCDEDFVFIHDYEGESRLVFQRVQMASPYPYILNVDLDRYGDQNMEREDWKHIKKLRIVVEYYETEDFLKEHGFEKLSDLNLCAYKLQNLKLVRSEKLGGYEIDWGDIPDDERHEYSRAEDLVNLFQRYKKEMVFEFEVDFNKLYQEKGVHEF